MQPWMYRIKSYISFLCKYSSMIQFLVYVQYVAFLLYYL